MYIDLLRKYVYTYIFSYVHHQDMKLPISYIQKTENRYTSSTPENTCIPYKNMKKLIYFIRIWKYECTSWGYESRVHRTDVCVCTHKYGCTSYGRLWWIDVYQCSVKIRNYIRIFAMQHTATQDDSQGITLQHAATRCNTLQHTATHCNTQQYTATPGNTRQHTATHCNTLQHPALPCNTLQHTATPCNTLQHPATPCNTTRLTWQFSIAISWSVFYEDCNTLQQTAKRSNTLQRTG